MAGLVKRSLLIFGTLTMPLFSCSHNQHITKKDKQKIADNTELCMQAIVEKDNQKLMDLLCSDIQDNKKVIVSDQIDAAFDFINGKIVSYDYKGIYGEEEHKDKGIISLYRCSPQYRDVTTDTNHEYIVRFTYHYIWDGRPECEGISMIRIEDCNSKESIKVGFLYNN